MKRNRFLLILSAAILLFAISCKKGGKTGLLVPSDAGFVLYFNSGSLSSKMSWSEVKQSGWFKRAERETTDSFARKLLNDPAASGVNTDDGIVFFLTKRGRGSYAAIQGGIKDEAKFEAMVKESTKGADAPAKSGDLNVLKLDESAVITWNKSKFMLLADAPFNMADFDRTGSGFSRKFSTDSLIIFAKNLYALKGKDLLDNDERFADLIKGKGDIQLWANSGALYNGGIGGGMLEMMKLSLLLEGNIATGYLSFDNGKITMEGKQYYGKEMTKWLEKYSNNQKNDDLVGRLPAGEVIAAGAYSYPMESLTDLLKLVGADGLANGVLGQKGITLDDIAKAFKGDMAFAITDITQKIDTVKTGGVGANEEYTTKKESADFVFGTAIKDQKSFDKVYSVFNEMFTTKPTDFPSVKTDKGWLLVYNNEPLGAGFLAGGSKPVYADKIKGHQFGAFINLQKIFRSFETTISDSTAFKLMTLSRSTWQDITTSADVKKGVIQYNVDVNFVDKNTNSLKQLNKFAEQASAIEESRPRYRDIMIDSVRAETPPAAFN